MPTTEYERTIRPNAYARHWVGPAKAKKPPAGIEGVTYVLERGEHGKRRRRKATVEDLLTTKRVCDASQAASDAIRREAGHEPVSYVNSYRLALTEALERAEDEPAKRRKVSRSVDTEDKPPSAEDVKRARRKRDAELARSNRDLAAMIRVARDDGESMVDLAKAMGMTRQALYLYVERNGTKEEQ